MDPQRSISVPGAELAVWEQGVGPPVVLCHGFPELAYSWRHQMPALASAGYHVVAPDQRGYGRSSHPEAVEDYDIVHLTDDLVAILDDLGEDNAVFVGHDWGAIVVWQMAVLHPERVEGVVGMSVPFLPRPPVPPILLLRQMFTDAFFYILYFQTPGVADAELGRDPAATMRRLMAADTSSMDGASFANDGRGFVERLPEPAGLPGWLRPEELDHYVAEFSRTGFTGGLNWYRNLDRNWALTEHLAEAHVTAPSLFIGGAADPVITFSPPQAMDGWMDDHRGTLLLEGAGHWVQQERPEDVNRALVDFLRSVHERQL